MKQSVKAKLETKAQIVAEVAHEINAKAVAPRIGSKSKPVHASGSGRRFVPVAAHGYSREEAQAFAPSSATLGKDDRRENRWRMKSHYTIGEKAKSYGPRCVVDDNGVWRSF